jgi:hypothetical protein
MPAPSTPEIAIDHESKNHRQDADHQRQPPAIDQTREHVAAELVGAERIARRADVAKPADHRTLIGIGQPEPRRNHGGNENQQ